MPELPEVQATVDYIKDKVLGRSVTGTKVLWHRTVANHTPRSFSQELTGLRIASVERRGKWIWIGLNHKSLTKHLFIHLRMSGSLDVVKDSEPLLDHDRITINLSGGESLRFNDVRKFGRCYLTADPELITAKLGVEPLDALLSARRFHEIITANRAKIKQVLLNQEIIAGIGNIYADEALWRSRIHPSRSAMVLTEQQTKLLLQSIRIILKQAITLSGTDFGDNVVEGGNYRPKVYGRTEESCHRCKSAIQRIIVAQRSTHFCPSCQG